MNTSTLTASVACGLCSRGAGELAALIRARDVSAREVIEAHLARIEEVNERHANGDSG